jgi:hypothetical protein
MMYRMQVNYLFFGKIIDLSLFFEEIIDDIYSHRTGFGNRQVKL